MSDTISSILDAIDTFLRYVAPGFIALALWLLAYPSLSDDPADLIRAHPEVALVGGLILGVTLNSIHVALIEDLFTMLVYLAYHIPFLRNRLPVSMQKLSTVQKFRAIEAQRIKRRISSDGPAKRFQDENDAYAATLTFLYCSSYSGLGIAVYQYFSNQCLFSLVLWSGVLFLLFALACDFRYAGLDVWAAREFPRLDSQSLNGRADGLQKSG